MIYCRLVSVEMTVANRSHWKIVRSDVWIHHGSLLFDSSLSTSFSANVIDQKESCRWVLRKKIKFFHIKFKENFIKLLPNYCEIIVHCVDHWILGILWNFRRKIRFWKVHIPCVWYTWQFMSLHVSLCSVCLLSLGPINIFRLKKNVVHIFVKFFSMKFFCAMSCIANDF